MITYTTPEKAGLDPKYIRRFLAKMEEQRINLHDVLMMRGDQIFFEKYWVPFTAEFPHRMYSVTKSFVSVAIGFLLQDGKLSLDDPIAKYFPDKLGPDPDPLLMTQTIRDMLMMSTCFVGFNWFLPEVTDRLQYYFSRKADKYPGTLFDYDSNGSYVLSCLVERLSGMPFLDYLKEKVLDRLGGFEDAEVLFTIDGTPWGDSALICRPRALLHFARFVMNGGSWEGEQLLDAEYLREATSFQNDTNMTDACTSSTWGYGYQFWMTEQGGYSMNGMGGQYAVCCPAKDLILVFNADDQLSSAVDTPRVFRAFYDLIAAHLDGARPEEKEIPLDAPLKLSVARGKAASPFELDIFGKKYVCHENPMGWKWFRLEFAGTGGALVYENAQGEKRLEFGRKENRFVKFPEYGYSDSHGNLHRMSGFRYDAAVSAGWIEEKKLQLRVQVIDRYFGLLVITIGFKDPDHVSICMKKAAEDFFDTYEGWLYASAEKPEAARS
ncbi:MAG: serine hydrolase [Lachnospiraceae bacterium]|nr:serine hydrolase [Lachnospiraceae bacterium]